MVFSTVPFLTNLPFMKPIFPIAISLAASALAAEKPNILFIFSDDHAEQAISAYGSKVNQTPHFDRLAAEGARFTNSFVTNSIWQPDERNKARFKDKAFAEPETLFDDYATRPAALPENKQTITRLQKEYKDDGQYAEPATWPKGSADGPFGDKKPLGLKSIAEAIVASVDAGS